MFEELKKMLGLGQRQEEPAPGRGHEHVVVTEKYRFVITPLKEEEP